jgi:hypothetical protein
LNTTIDSQIDAVGTTSRELGDIFVLHLSLKQVVKPGSEPERVSTEHSPLLVKNNEPSLEGSDHRKTILNKEF